ncbi:transcription factor SOX-8 [Brachionus plicatilis]|uniref:Transcription factor SOX-8 n=1 Tax=Brachionus plicatilis TaxID=10195 RepID=A0A3M7QDF5_BRAPC|nr:transcription factor SOX-8 [Brachionus plicatilis]
MEEKKLDLAVVETLHQFDLKPLGASIKSSKPHVKRPMNAFMVWSRSARKTISQNSQPLPSNQLSKTLGDMWNRLTYEQKLPFIEEANRLKQEHSRQNPGYKYQPKRKPKKTLRTVGQVVKQESGIANLKSLNLPPDRQNKEHHDLSFGSSSNQCASSWPSNASYYPNYSSSCFSYSPMYFNPNVNEKYFQSIPNPVLDQLIKSFTCDIF